MVVGLIKLDLQLSIFGLLLLLLWGRLKRVVVHGDVDVRYQEGRRGELWVLTAQPYLVTTIPG